MTKLAARQHEYLKAMGIDVWLPKDMAEPGTAESEIAQLVEVAAADEMVTASVSTAVPAQSEPVIADIDVSRLNWDALQTCVSECQLCDLHPSRTQTVFGAGNRNADWLIITEAPNAEEDRQGEIFVGVAGQLLTAMLQALDLKRQDVYITNTLKCCPQNRAVKENEVICCSPYLQRQIQLLQPKLILVLGSTAAQNLLQTNTTLGRLRGRVQHIDMTPAPVIVTYHPDYLLRSALEKRKSWEDLLFAKKTLASLDL